MQGNAQKSSALEKAVTILEAVVGEARPLGLPDLTAQVGLPKQTVHRVVRQLEANGLLRRDAARDRYAIGPRMNRLALDTLYASCQAAPTRAILQELVATIGETCNVGMLDGHEVVYIDRVECDWPLRVRLQAGSRVPVHCTAIGKLLLAHLPRKARRRWLAAAALPRYTDNTITDPGQFETELARILAQGYSTNDEEFALGLIAVAVPIRERGGRVLAALAVHAPTPRLSVEAACAHLPTLRAAAQRLGEALEPDGSAPDEP
ncbi:MAG: IclR family transcriptional regulator [Kiloniellaceae bacterium]